MCPHTHTYMHTTHMVTNTLLLLPGLREGPWGKQGLGQPGSRREQAALPAGLRALHMAGRHVCCSPTPGERPHYEDSQGGREGCPQEEALRGVSTGQAGMWEAGCAEMRGAV